MDEDNFDEQAPDYNWGNINTGSSNSNFSNIGSFADTPSSDTMGSSWDSGGFGVSAPSTESPDWMSQSNMFQPQNNFGQGLQQTTGLNNLGEYSQAGNLSSPTAPTQSSGIQSFLADLFNHKQGGGSGAQNMGTLLAALASGRQNTQKAGAINNMIQQQQARVDPFASQRPQYQQALASTIQNPYAQPIVKAQVDQLAQQQAIRDAAAGRRSNNATSSPALLAAQAQIAQQYMNSLMKPAGADINPTSAGLEQLMQGINARTNGYVSPVTSALGYNQQTNTNQAQIDALKQFLSGGQ